jgi:hypothetical protein
MKKEGILVYPKLKSINSCLGANLSRATNFFAFYLKHFVIEQNNVVLIVIRDYSESKLEFDAAKLTIHNQFIQLR